MSAPHQSDRNQEATVYLGNLDERCTDALVWELMLQAGPVVNVHLPKDRISQAHQGFGFCEFLTEEDAEYACRIMNQIKLYGKPVRVNKASYDKKQLDVGANLFIGNLDPNVDERSLYDTFSAFGIVSQTAKIARDPTTGESKGYGFISYNDFESADAAIESMNNQYLANKAITVQFAFKKDQQGERHGTPAERLLAHEAKKNNALPTGMMGGPMGGPPGRPPMMGNMGPGGLGSGANGTSMGYSPYPQGMGAPPPPPPPPAGFPVSYPPPGMGQQQYPPPGMGQQYPPPQQQQQQYGQLPPPPPPPGFANQYSVPPPGFGGGGAYPPPPPPPPPPMHMG